MTQTLRRAVFFDRDGVLNTVTVRDGKPYPPASLEELEISEGAPEAMRDLQGAGFLLIGITNQPDVARGTQRREVVEAIHAVLLGALPLEEIFVCYHDDGDGCLCRKPQPGLLLEAAARHEIDLSKSFMIGDRWKDVEAGRRAGCLTILLQRDYAEEDRGGSPHYRTRSLADAASWILHSAPVGGIT